MKPTVYLETTTPSYLTARLSRDIAIAAHQQVTSEWWEDRREDFDLYTSQFVIDEASAGDQNAAQRRLDLLVNVPLLGTTEEAHAFADDIMAGVPLPPNAEIDAIHIAIATVNAIDYLLTWNIKHIANAPLRRRLNAICRATGYESPVICTPDQLMGSRADA